MCLVLTGIHAYLAVHVLSREVVFVDIALAQIAALGATAAFRVVFPCSVRIAGVLLVFSYLIVPALAGIMFGRTIPSKLLIGWGFGTLVSVLGMVASAALDLPTGATVVCAFGLTLVALSVVFRSEERRVGKV